MAHFPILPSANPQQTQQTHYLYSYIERVNKSSNTPYSRNTDGKTTLKTQEVKAGHGGTREEEAGGSL